jgi:hypothetical protein
MNIRWTEVRGECLGASSVDATYQGQGITQKNEARGRFRELVGQILHFRVDFAIFGSDFLCLGIDDICQIGRQFLPFVKVRISRMKSSVPCVGK